MIGKCRPFILKMKTGKFRIFWSKKFNREDFSQVVLSLCVRTPLLILHNTLYHRVNTIMYKTLEPLYRNSDFISILGISEIFVCSSSIQEPWHESIGQNSNWRNNISTCTCMSNFDWRYRFSSNSGFLCTASSIYDNEAHANIYSLEFCYRVLLVLMVNRV